MPSSAALFKKADLSQGQAALWDRAGLDPGPRISIFNPRRIRRAV